MFSNPLKYQSGGTTATSEQEQQILAVFQSASKNTGIAVETLMEGLNQIQDESEKKSVVEAITLAAKGNENAITVLKKKFGKKNSSMFKEGGKIYDFVCKHKKGGKAGCGCKKQNGGQMGTGLTYMPYKSDKTAPFKKESFSKLEQNKHEDLGNNILKLVENQELNMTPQQHWSLYGAMRGYPSFVRPNESMPNNRVYGPEEKLAEMEGGGKVTKAQDGGNKSIWGSIYTDNLGRWRNFYDEYNGTAGTVNMNTGKAYRASTNEEMLQPGRYNRRGYPIAEGASTNGTWYEVTPRGGIVVNIPEGGQQVLHGTDSIGVANLINQWDQSKVGHAVTAKENGGNLKKKENANVEMHQQKNKGRGKLSTPVSITPKDSSKVEYNPSMQTLSFEDENGNNVTWTRNNFWGKPDGTYNWRSGRDVMFFNPNQNEEFIPYNRFKQWGTDIEGSTYLSPEDDARLKNLYEYARNKKTYIEPHYSWDSSIAERFWYWLKSLNRDKELTPGAPTFWEQTFKNGGKIK